MSSNVTVIYDACVLYPAPLRDFLMRLALLQPLQQHHIHPVTRRDIALGAVREPRRRFSETSLLKALQRALEDAFQPQSLAVLPIEDGRVWLPPAESTDPTASTSSPRVAAHTTFGCEPRTASATISPVTPSILSVPEA